MKSPSMRTIAFVGFIITITIIFATNINRVSKNEVGDSEDYYYYYYDETDAAGVSEDKQTQKSNAEESAEVNVEEDYEYYYDADGED